MSYKVIGIAGLPCSGKSEVAALMARLGAHVINADHVGHALLDEDGCRRRIVEHFGNRVLASDTRVNRSALAAIVFSDPGSLAILEELLHPVMAARIRAEAGHRKSSQPVVIDAALLVSMGLEKDCDLLVLVQADRQLRIQRAATRGWSDTQLSAREARIEQEIEAIRERAHLVVRNNGSVDDLRIFIDIFWKEQINGSNPEDRPAQQGRQEEEKPYSAQDRCGGKGRSCAP